MNAALALGRIADPEALAALREQAKAADDGEVLQGACLALGILGEPGDAEVLAELGLNPRNRRGSLPEAALALAKLPGAAPRLQGKLPEGERLAAAVVLAIALADPAARLDPHLEHPKALVRGAAAAGLAVRPPRGDAIPATLVAVQKALRKEKDPFTAEMLHYALGGLLPAGEARVALLDGATKDRERTGARAAACFALACEWGVQEHARPLKRALALAKDDLAGPLMLALASTGADEAVDELLKQARSSDPKRSLLAAGVLLHVLARERDSKVHPRHDEVLGAVERIEPLRALAQSLRGLPWPEPFRTKVHEGLETVPEAGPLWLAWRERGWALVNERLVPKILALDAIPDWGSTEIDQPSRDGSPSETVHKRTSGTPAEQDLISFLREAPYFGPEDLR
jgi:hypothetical protein